MVTVPVRRFSAAAAQIQYSDRELGTVWETWKQAVKLWCVTMCFLWL